MANSKLVDKLREVFVYSNDKPGDIKKVINTEKLEELLTDIVFEMEDLRETKNIIE